MSNFIFHIHEAIPMGTIPASTQYADLTLFGSTVSNETLVLTKDNSGVADALNSLILADNSQVEITFSVQGRAANGDGSLKAGKSFARRIANAASTEVAAEGAILLDVIFGTLVTLNIAVPAVDTTLGGVTFSVTGEEDLPMEWIAEIHTVNLFGA